MNNSTSIVPKGFNLSMPTSADGKAMWRLAHEAGRLDVNSSYSYLLWCREFAADSVVAWHDSGDLAGFIVGFRRPSAPSELFVWQVATAADFRGQGVASAMLDGLIDNTAVSSLTSGSKIDAVEATVTADNDASIALFRSFARRHDGRLDRSSLFVSTQFPDQHPTEELIRVSIRR
jgi:L-2,4-diaminobutyric acid acetyltransferase